MRQCVCIVPYIALSRQITSTDPDAAYYEASAAHALEPSIYSTCTSSRAFTAHALVAEKKIARRGVPVAEVPTLGAPQIE